MWNTTRKYLDVLSFSVWRINKDTLFLKPQAEFQLTTAYFHIIVRLLRWENDNGISFINIALWYMKMLYRYIEYIKIIIIVQLIW